MHLLSAILDKLKGGDRRSIGRSNEVVEEVLKDPQLFDPLFKGLLNKDPIIRMRAADAVEKITLQHPEYLKPYKRVLLEKIAASRQQEVRWHFAQIVPRLNLNQSERKRVMQILIDYLNDNSKIVITFAMQALADLADAEPQLAPRVIKLLQDQVASGSAAVKNRGQKLLKKLVST